jgi:anti-anti-sigma factor
VLIPAPFSATTVPGSPGKVCVVLLAGKLDPPACEVLDAKLDALLDAGERRFVLDLSKLSYLGSLGIRSFVRLAGRVKGDGVAYLSAPSPLVREVLELTKVDKVTPIYPDRRAAVEAAAG